MDMVPQPYPLDAVRYERGAGRTLFAVIGWTQATTAGALWPVVVPLGNPTNRVPGAPPAAVDPATVTFIDGGPGHLDVTLVDTITVDVLSIPGS